MCSFPWLPPTMVSAATTCPRRRLGSHVIDVLTAILIRVPAPEYLPSRRWAGEHGNCRANLAAGSLRKTKVSR
jgi:hypothetical protein